MKSKLKDMTCIEREAKEIVGALRIAHKWAKLEYGSKKSVRINKAIESAWRIVSVAEQVRLAKN